MVLEMNSLDVKRINHSTHLKVIGDTQWKDYLNSIRGTYTDPNFPPDKSSILGLGIDLNNKFSDQTA